MPGEKAAAPLGDYNNAVSKLTAALSSLQSDMQRLTEQQNQLLKKKNPATASKSWVIPASPKTSTPARVSREPTRDPSSASPSPSRRLANHAAPRSPLVQRRAQSVPPKSPKHQQPARPLEPKPMTFSRVIAPPQNVDRIPHLRRVNPWQSQVQTSSSFSIGGGGGGGEPHSLGPTPVATPTHTPLPPATPTPRLADDAVSVGSQDDHSIFSMDLEAGPPLGPSASRDGLASGACSSGAPSECSFESDAPASVLNGKRSSLIEISLSALRADGEDDEPSAEALADPQGEQGESETRAGVGFFFKVGVPLAQPCCCCLVVVVVRALCVHVLRPDLTRMTRSCRRTKWLSGEQRCWRNSRRERRR